MTHYREIGLPLKTVQTAVMRDSSPGKRQLILGAAVKAYPGRFVLRALCVPNAVWIKPKLRLGCLDEPTEPRIWGSRVWTGSRSSFLGHPGGIF